MREGEGPAAVPSAAVGCSGDVYTKTGETISPSSVATDTLVGSSGRGVGVPGEAGNVDGPDAPGLGGRGGDGTATPAAKPDDTLASTIMPT